MIRHTLATLAATVTAVAAATSASAAPIAPHDLGKGTSAAASQRSGTIPSGIPRSCWADVTTLLPGSTKIGWLTLRDGDDFVIDHRVNNSLGFTPKAMAIVDDEEVSDRGGACAGTP